MSERKPSYESMASNVPPLNGRSRQGQHLFSLKDPVRWFILGVSVYAIASLGVLCWALSGPSDGHWYWSRVLRTSDLQVNQFYSGLALSLLFAPAGILVRRISNDLALLHPFAVASEQPVGLAHLDLMMDPGLSATITLGRYSLATAVIQAIFVITGSLIVPIGTLLVTTENYAGTAAGSAVVGMPTTADSAVIWLSMDMGLTACTNFSINCLVWQGQGEGEGAFTNHDTFMLSTNSLLKGTLITQSGIIPQAPRYSGPTPTSNITLQEEVTYRGIITYQWKSGCEYNDEVKYKTRNEYGVDWLDVTLPDGNVKTWEIFNNQAPFYALASDTDSWAGGHSIPIGGSTYITLAYRYLMSVNVSRDSPGLDWIDFDGKTNNSVWISRVKCSPSLDWSTTDCVWKNKAWTDCVPNPDARTPPLDHIALWAMKYHLAAIPFYSVLEDPPVGGWLGYNGIFGSPAVITALTYAPTSDGRNGVLAKAPLLADYDNFYGFLSQLLATNSQNGYYGTATVETSGSAPRPAYVIRMYILLIIIALFLAIPILSVATLFSNIRQGHPLRRATFLTIAHAVRGPWWDETLWGGCAMSPDELRATYTEKVAFGVDAMDRRHIGLAPLVDRVDLDETYGGVRRRRKTEMVVN